MILIPSEHLRKIKLQRDSYIIYHSLFGGPTCVTANTLALLKKFSGGIDIVRDLGKKGKFYKHKDLIFQLKKGDFLVDKGLDEYSLFESYHEEELGGKLLGGRRLSCLRLEMASYCNFSCCHCFAKKLYSWKKNQKMSFTIAKLAVDGFLSLLKKNNIRSGSIIYWGGEPLLNWKVIVRLVKYIDRAIAGSPIKFTQGIVSNASLLNDSILGFMQKYKMGVRFSLDGLERENNRFRKFRDGRGTFKSIIKGLDGISRYRIPFSVELVLNRYNFYSVEKVIDFLQAKYNCNELVISAIFYQKRPSDFDCNSVKKKVKRIIEIYDYAVKRGIHKIGLQGLPAVNVAMGRKTGEMFHCKAITGNTLYVKPSGEIHSCQELGINIGDVHRMRDFLGNENYHNIAKRGVNRIQACRGCDIEGFCAGGCAALVKFYSGNIYGVSHPLCRKYYCNYMRLFFKEMLKYFAS